MPHSMTAFARSSGQSDWGEIVCELRSVNHRYLEISPRLSEEIRYLEPQIRDLVGERVRRGRVDCNMRLQARDVSAEALHLDVELVRRVVSAAHQIRDQSADILPLRVVDVLRWPGVIQTAAVDTDRLAAAVLTVLTAAVDDLVETRRREGARLGEILRQRVEEMSQIVDQVRAMLPRINQAIRERVERRLQEVRGELDPARVEQEIVLYVQRSDITEEIDRLVLHLDEVRSVLGKRHPIGRRLDFLMQELHREANTLGAKSVDAHLTQASVELKVLIDQMREQVQNIE